MGVFNISDRIKSIKNYTTSPLGAGETYLGAWEPAPRSMALVQSFSDVSGVMFFEFSVDGVNADSTFPAGGVTTSGGIPTVQPAAVNGRFFRVRYVNGSVAQAEFRLRAFWGDFSNFYSPLNQPYNLQSPAILTRGSWPWLDVARGLAGGVTSIKKFGRNDSVGTSFTPISLGGVYRTPQSSGAKSLRIKSGGNANDDASGSGARSITLTGTDENFLPVSETIVTAGTSASLSTTATFTRLFLIDVASSGTYASSAVGSHSGDIVIESSDGVEDWGTVDSSGFPKSGSEIGAYTIPAGFTGYMKLRDLSIDSGKTVDITIFSREGADEVAPPYSKMRARSVITGVSGGSIEAFGGTDVPFGTFVGPADIGALAKVNSGSASVAIEFEVILIEGV